MFCFVLNLLCVQCSAYMSGEECGGQGALRRFATGYSPGHHNRCLMLLRSLKHQEVSLVTASSVENTEERPDAASGPVSRVM